MAVNTSSPKAASPSPENSSPALAFNAATSASVSKGFPANAAGRSTGVALLFAHTPCRSGWPSAVRGGVHFVDAALSLAVTVCAWAAGIKVPTSNTSAITRTVRSHILMVHPLWFTAFGGKSIRKFVGLPDSLSFLSPDRHSRAHRESLKYFCSWRKVSPYPSGGIAIRQRKDSAYASPAYSWRNWD